MAETVTASESTSEVDEAALDEDHDTVLLNNGIPPTRDTEILSPNERLYRTYHKDTVWSRTIVAYMIVLTMIFFSLVLRNLFKDSYFDYDNGKKFVKLLNDLVTRFATQAPLSLYCLALLAVTTDSLSDHPSLATRLAIPVCMFAAMTSTTVSVTLWPQPPNSLLPPWVSFLSIQSLSLCALLAFYVVGSFVAACVAACRWKQPGATFI